MTCPNIDGSKSVGGCTFCTDDGSSSLANNASDAIRQQLLQGIEDQSKRFRTDQFIAYFQSFTNTYADADYLRGLYAQAVDHPAVKILAIGTRPDCVPEDVIDVIEEFAGMQREGSEQPLEVWVDIGVQTVHNQTLETINRAHSYEDFVDAAQRLKARNNPNLKICTHVILGLPGETPEMMLETAERLAKSPIDHIKIHQLCIFKGTPIEIDYLNDEVKVFEKQEYIELLAEFISRLPSDMVIQRLIGEGPRGELIAPDWAKHGMKQKFLSDFEKYLTEHDLYQGKHAELIAGDVFAERETSHIKNHP